MGLMSGRTAIVTGAAQGIGLSIAGTLATEGAKVVIADVNEQAVATAVDALSQQGAQVAGTRCDVTNEDDVAALVSFATDTFGSLDALVNNAGITRDATMRKLSLPDFMAVLQVSLVGSWIATKAASAVMREQGSGAIVNMSSISGKVGNIGQTNYSSAKAGLIGLTKASAKELARSGVRVNAIQPGLIRTEMTQAMRPEVWDQKMAEIPMQRAGEPDEVANAALFLLSDLSSYITGCVLEVAGGRNM